MRESYIPPHPLRAEWALEDRIPRGEAGRKIVDQAIKDMGDPIKVAAKAEALRKRKEACLTTEEVNQVLKLQLD